MLSWALGTGRWQPSSADQEFLRCLEYLRGICHRSVGNALLDDLDHHTKGVRSKAWHTGEAHLSPFTDSTGGLSLRFLPEKEGSVRYAFPLVGRRHDKEYKAQVPGRRGGVADSHGRKASRARSPQEHF
jgi:hypothetical protein